MNLIEAMPHELNGYIRIYREDDPSVILYEHKNVICNSVKNLFARLMADPTKVKAGVWGLMLGNGAVSVGNETSVIYQPVNEIKRIPLLTYKYIDTISGNPVDVPTTIVDFQTRVNATTDGISGAINEIGLIGGGKTDGTPTDMLVAAYLNPTDNGQTNKDDKVVLINYKTLPLFELPAGVNLVFSWQLNF